MGEWLDELMNEYTDICMYGWMDRWMDIQVYACINGQMDERMDGKKNGWMVDYVSFM